MKSNPPELSICAVTSVRNEADYLRVLLPCLAKQRIDVAILDNGSTDESRAIIGAHMSSPVITVKDLPFSGSFSLSEQLRAKQEMITTLSHDWVVHQDADEILDHRESEKNLRHAIQEADSSGYNALNFEEFVFLPDPGRDLAGADYRKEALRYYYFRPSNNRLNRAWKLSTTVAYGKSGGHRLEGDGIRFWTPDHVLRHYIVLSQEHAKSKYLDRTFAQEDLLRGWHTNRLGLTNRDLEIPEKHELIFRLSDANSKLFDRSLPSGKHYWHWED